MNVFVFVECQHYKKNPQKNAHLCPTATTSWLIVGRKIQSVCRKSRKKTLCEGYWVKVLSWNAASAKCFLLPLSTTVSHEETEH